MSGDPCATWKSQKIVRNSIQKRVRARTSNKNDLRTLSDAASGRPGSFRERPGAPRDPLSASRERPGSAPRHARGVPGASPSCPESAEIAPRAPGAIFARFGEDSGVWSARSGPRALWVRFAAPALLLAALLLAALLLAALLLAALLLAALPLAALLLAALLLAALLLMRCC